VSYQIAVLFRLLKSLFVVLILTNTVHADSTDAGKTVYDYYCYQCHAYAGDGKTLSSVFLDPPPRDFTAYTQQQLGEDRMIDAVRNGRQGTGMVPFSNVLSDQEIAAVVSFIRQEFMSGVPSKRVYHSIENGWENHERYSAAFPFILGSISLRKSPGALNSRQRKGRALYLGYCVSCHDRQLNDETAPLQWTPVERGQ